MSEVSAQSRYQVRFDQGPGAPGRIAAGVDVLVIVDAIVTGATTGATDGAAVVADGPAVVAAGFADAPAVAEWILAEQGRIGRRAYIAIVAAGLDDGAFAADDVLAAGAVIDALAALGIDDTSPEAAVACAAYGGLRRAVRHLATASVSGRLAEASGVPHAELAASVAPDPHAAVRILRASSGL